MGESAVVHVFRFNPQDDERPVFQEFKVPYDKKKTVLDALQYIYESVDSSLAFRESCQSGFCGLCGLCVNGKTCLACATYMTKRMKIEPLHGRTIIRDLVVDL
jgi:succinate dehydrogenase/fumarate reductase iron-sulfur protein